MERGGSGEGEQERKERGEELRTGSSLEGVLHQ